MVIIPETDYVIVDQANVWMPGRLPFRERDSKRGYATYEQAQQRIARIIAHYNAHYGTSPGDLRVLARTKGGKK